MTGLDWGCPDWLVMTKMEKSTWFREFFLTNKELCIYSLRKKFCFNFHNIIFLLYGKNDKIAIRDTLDDSKNGEVVWKIHCPSNYLNCNLAIGISQIAFLDCLAFRSAISNGFGFLVIRKWLTWLGKKVVVHTKPNDWLVTFY